jgi:beta-glucosidase/6-phospho-beta-glucosidase/beta-galactosidase/ABC-type amino acid transport substrate-binding protein
MFFWDCLGLNYRRLYRELRRSPSPPPLPGDFIFGVATADHQCEAYLEKCRDIRDIWEPEVRREPRGRATDFWHKCFDDVDRAKDIGCKAFRFSVSWSRVESSSGQFNYDVLEHYRRLVKKIQDAEMEPVLTLHHFTWPPHVNMIDDSFPEAFRRYVEAVANSVGQSVRYWVTINEPNHLIWGYFKPWWEPEFEQPPGHLVTDENASVAEQFENVGKLIRNMFLAHSRAYDEIKKVNPDALVGTNPYTYGLPSWLQCLFNSNALKAAKGISSFQELVCQNPEKKLLEGQPRDRGDADVVIANLTKTPDRERSVNFSDVYFVASQQLMVKSGSSVESAQDLAGKMVAVVAKSTAHLNPPPILQKSQLITVHDYDKALELLNLGHAEAILADNTILNGLMGVSGQYRIIDEELTNEPYAAAVTSGHRQLLVEVNKAIREFKKSGDWERSCMKHKLPISPMPPNVARTKLFSPLEAGPEKNVAGGETKSSPLQRIKDRGYLKVAVKSNVPGFGYYDPEYGEYSGLEIDLAHAIAEQILGDGSKVRFYPTSTEKRISKLHSSFWGLLDSMAKLRCVLSTAMAYSNWWYLGMAGKLPEFLCPEECWRQPERDFIPKELWHKPKQDYIGLDYYYGIWTLRFGRIMALLNSGKKGDFRIAPVWPGALYSQMVYLSKLFPYQPGLPILILENGCVDNVDILKSPIDRQTYICQHVQQVQRAVADGINVKMYIYWSLTANREWGFDSGPGTDFGLYGVDLDIWDKKKQSWNDGTLNRKKKEKDIEIYKKIIQNRGSNYPGSDCNQPKSS